MKKIFLLFVILLLGGCYDYTEIDDIAIVTGIILDYKNNQYEMISETLENEKESKKIVYKTACDSIDLCILKITDESNKEVFISHLKVLILTDRTVDKDISFYDYFIRNSKSKMNFYIYHINDQYIDKIFDILEDNTSTSLFLKDMTDFNTKNYSSSIKFLLFASSRIESSDAYSRLFSIKLFCSSVRKSLNASSTSTSTSKTLSFFLKAFHNSTLFLLFCQLCLVKTEL